MREFAKVLFWSDQRRYKPSKRLQCHLTLRQILVPVIDGRNTTDCAGADAVIKDFIGNVWRYVVTRHYGGGGASQVVKHPRPPGIATTLGTQRCHDGFNSLLRFAETLEHCVGATRKHQ